VVSAFVIFVLRHVPVDVQSIIGTASLAISGIICVYGIAVDMWAYYDLHGSWGVVGAGIYDAQERKVQSFAFV
jgi:hypothetical protein